MRALKKDCTCVKKRSSVELILLHPTAAKGKGVDRKKYANDTRNMCSIPSTGMNVNGESVIVGVLQQYYTRFQKSQMLLMVPSYI